MLEDVHRRRIAPSESAVEIALLDWGGEGPLALLHHANGFCSAVWEPVAERLRRHFRVVAMDARGHGDSSVPEGAASYRWDLFGRDLAGVAKALAAEHSEGRIALGLGHSFGGTAFLMASAAEPGLFERIALLDPVIPPPPSASSAERRRGSSELAEGARSRRNVWPNREAARVKWSQKAFFADWDARALEVYAAEGLRDRPDGQVELKCTGEVEALIFESGYDFDPWAIAPRVAASTRILWAQRGSFPREIF